MSGNLFLDWLTLTVSLYNTLVLLWLGMIVLLTAERRHLGIWLAGGGLLTGAAFFLSHSAILGLGFITHPAIDFWWRIGWIPVILSPFAWYVVMLWYAGYWEAALDRETDASAGRIHHWHRPWLWLLGLATLGFSALLVFAHPLPSFRQVLRYDLSASPSLNGVPALIALYPLFIVACIGLSLDALLRPGPTMRMAGAAARRRARPWLAAASATLLLVSLLVAGILWAVVALGSGRIHLLSTTAIVVADLLIDFLIAVAVSLTGQAIVVYEIFTGKSLPRGGLQRAWQRTLVLTLGLGTATGLILVLDLPAIYTLLVSVVLVSVFYALLVWRSYHERELVMGQLRPFAGGRQSFQRLAASEVEAGRPETLVHAAPANEPFAALCAQVLGASWGWLEARGALRELFGAPWIAPEGASPPIERLALPQSFNPQILCLPLAEPDTTGTAWAVPLWNEHGCCGLLLLGEKTGGGVYTEEEIETARAVCERLVDAQAGEEAARRLLGLQRRQLAESQALDRRARRALHDDILPLVHAALLAISRASHAAQADPEQQAGYQEAAVLLTGAHRGISDLLHDSPAALTPETARRGLVEALRRVVDQELQGAFDQVSWKIEPRAEAEAARLPPLAAEALFYAAREAMRNVARHARPPQADAELHLHIGVFWADGIEVCIEDNGVGMGDSKREAGGSGQGMALHATLLALAGGWLQVEAAPEAGSRVRLWLPAA